MSKVVRIFDYLTVHVQQTLGFQFSEASVSEPLDLAVPFRNACQFKDLSKMQFHEQCYSNLMELPKKALLEFARQPQTSAAWLRLKANMRLVQLWSSFPTTLNLNIRSRLIYPRSNITIIPNLLSFWSVASGTFNRSLPFITSC